MNEKAKRGGIRIYKRKEKGRAVGSWESIERVWLAAGWEGGS